MNWTPDARLFHGGIFLAFLQGSDYIILLRLCSEQAFDCRLGSRALPLRQAQGKPSTHWRVLPCGIVSTPSTAALQRKHQIPSTKDQTSLQFPSFIGVWILFGIWILEFDISNAKHWWLGSGLPFSYEGGASPNSPGLCTLHYYRGPRSFRAALYHWATAACLNWTGSIVVWRSWKCKIAAWLIDYLINFSSKWFKFVFLLTLLLEYFLASKKLFISSTLWWKSGVFHIDTASMRRGRIAFTREGMFLNCRETLLSFFH